MHATSSKHTLRDYQRRAVERVRCALDRRPILVAPTGSGKTVMATALVEQWSKPTLWLAHRKELIDQAAHRLRAHGLSVGIIMAGHAPEPAAQVQVASVQTLARRDKPHAELIVIDECHHATAQTYGEILDCYPDAHRVGLTATPFRLDGRGLGDLFGELVVAATTKDLCDSGILHAPKVWCSKSPDLRGVKVIAGEYSLGALAKRTNTTELNADVVASWVKRAEGRRTVAFAVDVEHSRAIAAAFGCAGIAAEHLDGATPRDQRDAILARLASGQTQIVCNCMVLTEGWDLPALECAIIARPTASLNLHLQMIGRVMRACDGKDGAIVLDHAGNHHVHGLVTRRLDYSLDGDTRVGHEQPLGIRRCQQCGLMFDTQLPACPECGWVPVAAERERPIIHGAGELHEFDDSSFEYRRQVWNLIEAERMAMGYRQGWSLYRFQERFGVMPVLANGELIDPHHATQEQKRSVFEHLAEVASTRGFNPGWASHRFRDLFGHWPRGFVGEMRAVHISRRWNKRVS
ncbi:DEAD/DEAH box helicase [Fontivita pretiosa]|uniref:DEAD/DEAH box helicase n=1 Tax=Fontivita pretiosa TaxID=2989684 RepID=UPI003D178008